MGEDADKTGMTKAWLGAARLPWRLGARNGVWAGAGDREYGLAAGVGEYGWRKGAKTE